MEITIDTSALIAVIGNEGSKQRIIELTEGGSLLAPASVHWEIGNAFSAMFKRQVISIDVAQEALAAYHSIPIKYIDVPLERTLHIAKEFNIYAYDAYLIQCAEQTSSRLLTLDKGLARTAKQMGISLLEV
ncbi:type II toxin-antitoxin system VapC family toxin [Leucothrix pacifica]|uniref:VapC toxin family PIN domain ribonuclease n=1 Tax=Leucothrix pacifica TaxID=1247513 RepID=A0A317C9B3_9GAMM|nr:type II toxin-antitoxin system VapC family toxin [Leucothrix pacifica]PWQ95118.1 VapC toxin family PIN domain ribonuclease [Leucothrix pacifica]